MQKDLFTRLISGLLATSMVLSMVTSSGLGYVNASAHEDDPPPGQEQIDKDKDNTVSEGKENSEPVEIAMPLELDKSAIGFSQGMESVEVTATMTDVQYLGVLSIDEYASFFPVELNLSKVDYLTDDQKSYINSMSEADRAASRSAALAKLQVKEQFIWEAAYDGKSYDDSILIEPIAFGVREATEDRAPSMTARVKISWIGETPVVESTSSMLNQMTGTRSSSGSKSIADEDPAIQDFLYEMWKSGGLTQENSDYDLSYFTNGTYKPSGASATASTQGTSFNLMGSSSTGDQTTSTDPAADAAAQQTDDKTQGEVNSDVTTTNNTLENKENEEKAVLVDSVSGATDGVVSTENESSLSGAAAGLFDRVGNLASYMMSAVTGTTTTTSQVAEAAAQTEGGDETTAEGEKQSEETSADELDIPTAYFGVRIKSNESIQTYGVGYYVGGTSVAAETGDQKDASSNNNETDDKTESGENAEAGDKTETPAASGETTKTDSKTEPAVGTTTSSKPQTSTGPSAPVQSVADAEAAAAAAALTAMMNAYWSTDTTYEIRMTVDETEDVSMKLQTLVGGECNEAHYRVLDTRVATVDENGLVTALNEGNTKVVLYAYDAGWTPVMAEVNLTVRGKYTLSSQDKTAPEVKRVVPMVASGMTASLALKADGTVWGWGNDDGILKATEQGSNSYNNPAQIVLSVDEEFVPMTGIVKISVGFNYALALKADGTVYSWGVNTSGQLGNGMISDKTQQYPEYVMDGMAPLSGVVDISAGGSHSLALLEDGRVMAWGSNGTAQLGKGDYSDNAAQPVFVQWALGDLSGIVQVAAGGSFSVALAYDGTVYAWGDNRRGQMGNGKDGSLDYYVVKAEVVDIRDKNQQLRRAVDIAASRRIGQAGTGSYGHVLALTIPDFCDSRDVVWDTAVYGWGYNEYCAVRGIYKTTSSGSTLDTSDVRTPTLVEWASGNQPGLIVDVEAGNDHSLARDVNGRLYGWGYNNQGRVGVGTEAYSSGSTAKVEDPTQMWTGEVKEGDKLKNDGYVGDAGMEAIAMSAGDAFTVVLMRDGSVYSVGDNSANQLGTCGRALGGYGNNERTTGILVRTGDLVDRYILMNKVIVYTKQMMANGETAFVATSRYAERPGMFNETSELASLTELQLPKELTITDSQYIKVFKEGISRFYEVGFNLSERDRGNAYTEEDNEILLYRVDPMGIVDLEEEVTTNDVKAFPHMLTETDYAHGDTEFYVAEDNADPYEGGFNIHVKDADNFTTPALKAGDGFMVALKSDGTVYAWGDNTYGQLGNGDPTLARSVGPVQVVGADGPDGMKLILVEEISVGGSHVLARAGDGSVYAWGRNHVGQLGDGTREDRFYPVRVKNSSGNGYMAGATSVAAGGEHSLATLAKGDGYVYAWGGNDRGQLGLGWEGTGEEKVLYSSLPQFVSSGEGDPMTDVEKVYAGYKHSAAMGKAIPSDKYNVLKAWGDNTYGQVGVGQEEPYIYVPADVATSTSRLDNVVDAALGAYHTVAMTRNDLSGVTTVYMGGRNEEGQLGRTEALVNGGGGIVYNMSPLLEFWGMNHTNEPVKDAIRLSAGKDHTIILRGKVENGDEIYTGAMLFGGDTYRQLGMGTEHKEYGEEGELLFRYRELSVVEAGSLESITAGWETTSVIDREGRVYTWGKNDDGELGEFSLLGGEAVNNPGNDEAWIPNVDSVLVDPNAQYTLSVTVQKDGVVWGDSGKEFTLVGGTRNNVVMVESKVETENGSKGTGLYTAQVSAGTYTLYEGTINRGEVVAAYNRLDQKVLNYVPVEISLMKWADDAWAAWTDSKKQLSLRDSSAVNADDDIPMTELDI